MKTYLRALLPSRWLLAGLAVTLGFRALAWLLRAALARPEATLRSGFKGIVWDLVLVYGLFALARAGGLLARPDNPARMPWRFAGWALLAPALVVGGLSPLMRMVDVGHCYLARSHWGLEGFLYLHADFIGRLLDPAAAGLLLGGLSLAGFMVFALLRHTEAARRAAPSRSLALALLPLLISAPPAAWALRDGIAFPAHVYELRLLPETNFVASLVEWLRESPQWKEEEPPLDPALAARLVRAGLLPSVTPAVPGYPLVRDGLNEPPLAHARRPGVAADLRPNVVLTFVESLNSVFVHGLGGRFRGLTPELDALAQQMTSVEGFHNTSSPTIAALVSVLCSVHPPSHPRDLRPGQSVDGAIAYSCLGDILGARGYRTVYVQAASKEAASKEYFLRKHGFDEVYGRADLRRRWPGGPEGPWGAHDDVMVRFAIEQIGRLEGLRAQDGRPFLLVMLTLDTHDPGMAGPECDLPRDADGRPAVEGLLEDSGALRLAAAYHCADAAVGELGRFLLRKGRRERTLWALTADHGGFLTVTSAPLMSRPGEGWSFVRVPLLLHDPAHALPPRVEVLSGSEDVAPTLLHLLGIDPGLNSLTGHSVFGKRCTLPWLVGRIGGRLTYLHTATARREVPIGMLDRWCAAGKEVLSDGSAPLSACELAGWIRWQDALWASRRLFPAPGYLGTGLTAD